MATRRITKSMAENASVVMAKKAYDSKIADLRKQIAIEIEALVIKYIPAPVIACAKEFPSYFHTYNQASIAKMVSTEGGYEHRSSWINADITIPIPSSCDDIVVSEKEYNDVKMIYDKITSLKKEREELADKLCNTLISLRTDKNIMEQFPEAMKYIEFPVEKNLPAPVLNDLRSIIGALN